MAVLSRILAILKTPFATLVLDAEIVAAYCCSLTMKYLISKFRMVCSKCGKKGKMSNYSDGSSFCEHGRKKSDIVIMGQSVMNVEGCYFPVPEKLKKK